MIAISLDSVITGYNISSPIGSDIHKIDIPIPVYIQQKVNRYLKEEYQLYHSMLIQTVHWKDYGMKHITVENMKSHTLYGLRLPYGNKILAVENIDGTIMSSIGVNVEDICIGDTICNFRDIDNQLKVVSNIDIDPEDSLFCISLDLPNILPTYSLGDKSKYPFGFIEINHIPLFIGGDLL